MISFVWSIFSVVLESLDSLRMDNILESLAFVLPNFMGRTLILILIQSFLQAYWTLFFMAMVIACNVLIVVFMLERFSCLKCVAPSKLREICSITPPEHKHKIVSALVSFPLCLLVSNNITKKERGKLEPEEARRQAEKYLAVFSITNMMVFLPLSYMFIFSIIRGILNTDRNVILSTSQMYDTFLYIALPLCALAVIASVLLLLSPLLNDKLKIFLHLVLIASSVIYPAAAGMTIIENSPTSVLIFVQNKHCVTIFEGHTNTTQSFDIEQAYKYNKRNISIENKKDIIGNVKVRFDVKKFNELENEDNVYIEETTDIKIMKLKSEFLGKCFFCAAESNLCRRTFFSLGSQSDNVCDIDQCPSTECLCEPWSEWSPQVCPKKCGGGRRFRVRSCEEGKKCVEAVGEQNHCNTQECEWSAWTQWSDCSKKCGGGRSYRSRHCGEENQCTGNSNEGKDCNQEDCQWSAWSRSQWSNSCKIYRYCPEQNRCEGNTQEKTIPNCKSGKPKLPTS